MIYRERRYPCMFPIEVRTSFGRSRAVLKNISYHGACASTDDRLHIGDECQFDILNMPVRAVVTRYELGGLVGLRFRTALSKRQLARMRNSQTLGRFRPQLSEMR